MRKLLCVMALLGGLTSALAPQASAREREVIVVRTHHHHHHYRHYNRYYYYPY